MQPKKVEITEAKTVAWCACKIALGAWGLSVLRSDEVKAWIGRQADLPPLERPVF